MYYRITGPSGRFVTGYSNAPDRPDLLEVERGVPAFFDAETTFGPIRVVVLEEFIPSLSSANGSRSKSGRQSDNGTTLALRLSISP